SSTRLAPTTSLATKARWRPSKLNSRPLTLLWGGPQGAGGPDPRQRPAVQEVPNVPQAERRVPHPAVLRDQRAGAEQPRHGLSRAADPSRPRRPRPDSRLAIFRSNRLLGGRPIRAQQTVDVEVVWLPTTHTITPEATLTHKPAALEQALRPPVVDP